MQYTPEQIKKNDSDVMRALSIGFVIFIATTLIIGGLMNLFYE